jgi:hypothetical protein
VKRGEKTHRREKAMSYYAVFVDASVPPLVGRGDHVRRGQPIGRARKSDTFRFNGALEPGIVRQVQFDPRTQTVQVVIERDDPDRHPSPGGFEQSCYAA